MLQEKPSIRHIKPRMRYVNTEKSICSDRNYSRFLFLFGSRWMNDAPKKKIRECAIFFWWNRLVAFILAQPSNEQLRSKNIYRQLKKGWFSWVIAHGKTEEYSHQAETPCKECITESHLNHSRLRFFGRFFLLHVVVVTRHKTANQTCSE